MELILNKGFLSEYDFFMIWVENFCEGSPAYYIECEEDKKFMTSCILAKVIKKSDYSSEGDYDKAVENIIGKSKAIATGEFVTFHDIYYVGIKDVGDRIPITQFSMNDVNYS